MKKVYNCWTVEDHIPCWTVANELNMCKRYFRYKSTAEKIYENCKIVKVCITYEKG